MANIDDTLPISQYIEFTRDINDEIYAEEQQEERLLEEFDQDASVEQRLYLNSKYIVNIKESSFIENDILIQLKIKNCIVILFYGNDELSKRFLSYWIRLQQEYRSILYGVANCLTETKIDSLFQSLNTKPNHPMYWARLVRHPFILVYKDGWPQAMFNYRPSYNNLKLFCMRACNYSGVNYNRQLNIASEIIKEEEEEELEEELEEEELEEKELKFPGLVEKTSTIDRAIKNFKERRNKLEKLNEEKRLIKTVKSEEEELKRPSVNYDVDAVTIYDP